MRFFLVGCWWVLLGIIVCAALIEHRPAVAQQTPPRAPQEEPQESTNADTRDDARQASPPRDAEERLPASRLALQPLQALVGEWRGAGQLRRGSSEGGWTEEVAWVWRFDERPETPLEKRSAELVFTVARGKYFVGGRLTSGDKAGAVELYLKPVDGAEVRYSGTLAEDGSVQATAAQVPQGMPERVSMRLVAGGDRLVILLERRSAISDRFARLAEVGYTRKGSQFGKGSSQPECVVTGGLGTIQVSYQGQMYYVCCAGCRDLFEQKPAEILAEYRERKAAEKAAEKAK